MRMREIKHKLKKIGKRYFMGCEWNVESFNRNFCRHARIIHRVQEDLASSERILDIGPGIGVFAIFVKEIGKKVSVIDHPEAIREDDVLEKNNIPIDRVDVLCEKIPYPANYFDMVTMFDIIEHLHGSPHHCLQEVRRVLEPNGVLFLTTPNAVNLRKRTRVLLGKSNYPDLESFFRSEYPYKGHVREYTKSEIERIMIWSGFTTVRLA